MRQMPTFRSHAGLARLSPEPVDARGSRFRPARWMRTATSSGLATRSRTRRSGSTRRSTRRRSSCSRCAIGLASTRTSSCRPPVTAPTTARSSTRCAHPTAAPRGIATVDRERHRPRTAGHARGRRARHPLQLRPPPRRLHAARGARRDRPPHRAARLARGDLLRSGRPAGAVGLLHVAADDGGRRPHGTAGCHESRWTARSSSCSSG